MKTLQKAVEQVQQESASLQVAGLPLTPEEQKRVKTLNRTADLVRRALDALL